MKYEMITAKKVKGSYKVKVLETGKRGKLLLTVVGKNDLWKIKGRYEEPSPELLKVLKEAQYLFEGTGEYKVEEEEEPISISTTTQNDPDGAGAEISERNYNKEPKPKTLKERIEEEKRKRGKRVRGGL